GNGEKGMVLVDQTNKTIPGPGRDIFFDAGAARPSLLRAIWCNEIRGKPMNISEKINLTQASELLGVSVKTVSILCSEGHIERDKHGEVTVGGAVHGYVKSIKANGTRADGEYKQVKTEELKHRTAHREGKYQQAANEEAYAVCMEAWP